MNDEKIWYEDLQGFITSNNYFTLLPSENMLLQEKLNALLRFFLYLGIILALIKADSRYLFFGIVAAIISILVYEMYKVQVKRKENFMNEKGITIVDNKVCSLSTVDNPFMNATMADYGYNPSRPAACNVLNEDVKEQMDENFNERLFKDVGDLYGKMASQRQFYTMPVTTIPNDQTGFAEWLYGTGPTCKEGNGMACRLTTYLDKTRIRT